MIRQQKTKSGRLLEIDSFPVWNDGRRVSSRAPKAKPSTEEQKRYNKKQAEKKLIRLINANFDEDDIIMHPTYEPTNAPQDEKQARKDLTNYFRRLKTRRQKELAKVKEALKALPEIEALAEQREELLRRKKKLETPFKYIYVIECVTYKTGELKGCNNYHFHVIFTGGISRKELEAMWQNGIEQTQTVFSLISLDLKLLLNICLKTHKVLNAMSAREISRNQKSRFKIIKLQLVDWQESQGKD